MTRAEMLAELNDVLHNAASGGAWSDPRLLGYLAEGQDKFCEETGFFTDISNYTITAVADQANYDIDERIIEVLDIFNGATQLGKFDESDRTRVENVGKSTVLSVETGNSYSWQADRETDSITLYPTPGDSFAGTTLTLRVWRYSRNYLASSGAEPEIPVRFHRACIEWALFKALNHHDMEAQEPTKAQDHLDMFWNYVADGKAALVRKHSRQMRVTGNPLYTVR